MNVVDDPPVELLPGHRDLHPRVTTEHGHPLSTATGCTGSIQTFLDGGHAGADDLTAVFVASYTDSGSPPQTGTAQVVLTPTGD